MEDRVNLHGSGKVEAICMRTDAFKNSESA